MNRTHMTVNDPKILITPSGTYINGRRYTPSEVKILIHDKEYPVGALVKVIDAMTLVR